MGIYRRLEKAGNPIAALSRAQKRRKAEHTGKFLDLSKILSTYFDAAGEVCAPPPFFKITHLVTKAHLLLFYP